MVRAKRLLKFPAWPVSLTKRTKEELTRKSVIRPAFF